MRNIKKELQELRKRADKEFGVKDNKAQINSFIARAEKFLSGQDSAKEPECFLDERSRKDAKSINNPYSSGEISRRKLIKKLMEGGKTGGINKTRRKDIFSHVRLEEAVLGRQEDYGGASFYRIADSVLCVDPEADKVYKKYCNIISCPAAGGSGKDRSIDTLRNSPIDDVCYLDLETTGLRNSPLFLVGLMYSLGGRLVLDQFFARDYTEEFPLLEFTRDFLKNFSTIITFNGRGFDIPFMLDRMKLFGIESSLPEYHVDLLPISRRIVGKRTSNHKLSTLEKEILGRERIADLPGWKIPEVYHDYVRTGNAVDIKGVIKHNRIDLISMLRLIVFFLSDELYPEEKD
ncbi:MAG: ribonuclease H-like domain-containing protein [Candidatus Krumholzibacteriota bacterium]|nr:ribonuclease H-like domain-containing protein [Candidatus Krumholzibacteriota bacterium]